MLKVSFLLFEQFSALDWIILLNIHEDMCPQKNICVSVMEI